MRYDLIVTQIDNESSRKVLAHQLARDPGTTFQGALLKLQKLPVVLFNDIDEQTMAAMVSQYLKYGVRLKAVPAHQKSKGEEIHHPESQHLGTLKASPSYSKDQQCDNAIKTVLLSNDISEKRVNSGIGVVYSKADLLEENEKKKRVKERTLLIIFLIIFLIVPILLILFTSRKKEYRYIPGVGNAVSVKSPANITDPQGKHLKKKPAESELSKRKSISAADKKKSEAICDSVKNAGANNAVLINFYKIAISFNKYNLDAWFGLLDAYRTAGMSDEYNQTSNQMKDLFGDNVFDISSQVKRFGDIEDMFENENGALTIKYRTSEPLDGLQERVYSLIKILHSNYGYQSISIEIADKKTDRMMVHVRPGMEIATFADFKKNASVMIFDKK